jgi:hypothetical protein
MLKMTAGLVLMVTTMGVSDVGDSDRHACKSINLDYQAMVREARVNTILNGMWTCDKDVIRAAIEDSMSMRDERLRQSLIGRMYMDCPGLDPDYWYVQLIVESLQAQGVKVGASEHGWRLEIPGEPRRTVPYSMVE